MASESAYQEFTGKSVEEALKFACEAFKVGLADLPEQQTFQSGNALAVIRSHLRQQPMRLPAATGTAVADGRRSVGAVAKPGCSTGHQLPLLQPRPRRRKVPRLVHRTARIDRRRIKHIPLNHGFTSDSGFLASGAATVSTSITSPFAASGFAVATGALYVTVMSIGANRADRFIFPAYVILGTAGAGVAVRQQPQQLLRAGVLQRRLQWIASLALALLLGLRWRYGAW